MTANPIGDLLLDVGLNKALTALTGSSFIGGEIIKIPQMLSLILHDGASPSLVTEAIASDFMSSGAGHVFDILSNREGPATALKNLLYTVPNWLMTRAGVSGGQSIILKNVTDFCLSLGLDKLYPMQEKIDEAVRPLQQLLSSPIEAAEQFFDKVTEKSLNRPAAGRNT